MKKKAAKQMMMIAGGVFSCGIQMMGCYPIAPAYFAAAFLEDINGIWLTALMYIAMLYFMPLTAAVKYAVVILVVAGALKFVCWANDGCPAFLAGIFSAVTTMILSFCGGLLQWRDQPKALAVLLEGIFIFGATILFDRCFHSILEWNEEKENEKECVTGYKNEERLFHYAESFQGLSQVFLSMSGKKETYTPEELGRIQNELTQRLCAGCDSCAICWQEEKTPLYEVISKLLTSVLNVGVPKNEDREELSQYCKRSEDMAEEAVRVFERANLNRAWYNRLIENRQTIAEQLDAMAYIMKDCAREETLLDAKEKKALAQIRYHAKEHGILVEQMHVFENMDGHLKMEARLKSKMGGCISIKTFQKMAGNMLGKQIRGAADGKSFVSKEASDFLFYEDTKYRTVQGIARQKKDGAKISGDNFSFLELECGQLLLGLSDGMGSGCAACRESEMVLDLVERFLEAGFSVETAIRMMNTAMVMKGENDLYSTIDLCMINLYDGTADFYKIGAAASFLKRGKETECFFANSLPVGVGTNPQIEKTNTTLKNGDFVVMVTDGVLEYLHVPNPEETMQEIIESIDTNNPGVLAKKILERVLLFTGGKVSDDMTILTTCIWEK